jgi:hypothetical protein
MANLRSQSSLGQTLTRSDRPTRQSVIWRFPSQTSGGSIREDRLVLPIPPGTTWRDAKPLILPGAGAGAGAGESKELPSPTPTPKARAKRSTVAKKQAEPVTFRAMSGLRAGPPPQSALAKSEAKREPKKKAKNDPRYVAAARELRDRWLEKANDDPSLIGSNSKYDVTRAIGTNEPAAPTTLQLPAAA